MSYLHSTHTEQDQPMKKTCALLAVVLMRTAVASLDTNPYIYDPTFNGGVIVEDGFVSTTVNSGLLGLKLAIAANGDIIAAGIVSAAFQTPPPNNLGLVRYSANGGRVAWSSPTPAYSFFNNRYIDSRIARPEISVGSKT